MIFFKKTTSDIVAFIHTVEQFFPFTCFVHFIKERIKYTHDQIFFAKKKDDDALDEILSFEQTNQGDALSIAVLILLCGCFFLWYDNVGIYMT